jgi:hypothetical protein
MRVHASLCSVPVIALAWLGLAAGAMPTAAAATLAGHRALYDLVLETAKGGDIVAAKGRMSYEVEDACDGWTTRQRLEMLISNRDGQDIQMVSDYATWESTDGHRFRFHMKQTTDTAVASQTEGEATTGPEGGEVHYTLPSESTKTLPPGTLLPMAHTAAIIDAARAGKKFIGIPLFDGTSEQGGQDTSITVLDYKPAGDEGAKWPDLLKLPSAHVHVAFFDRKADSTTPEYEVGMRYWANGVGDNMRMDFGTFVMDATMSQFALLPRHC